MTDPTPPEPDPRPSRRPDPRPQSWRSTSGDLDDILGRDLAGEINRDLEETLSADLGDEAGTELARELNPLLERERPDRTGWAVDVGTTARHALVAIPGVAAVTAATIFAGTLFAPGAGSLAALAIPLLTLVFLVSAGLDVLDDASDRIPILRPFVNQAAELAEKGGASFYGSVAAAEFFRREFFSFRDAIQQATSLNDFVFGELLSLGWETVWNAIQSSMWPFFWGTSMGWTAVGIIAAGAWVTWSLGRWTLVEKRVALPPGDEA